MGLSPRCSGSRLTLGIEKTKDFISEIKNKALEIIQEG